MITRKCNAHAINSKIILFNSKYIFFYTFVNKTNFWKGVGIDTDIYYKKIQNCITKRDKNKVRLRGYNQVKENKKNSKIILYTEREMGITINLPSLQRAPAHPSAHVHVKHPSLLVKVPPFWHGLDTDWLIAKIKRNNNVRFLTGFECSKWLNGA